MKLSAGLAAIAASLAVSGVAAVPQWGQCGGIGYTGVSNMTLASLSKRAYITIYDRAPYATLLTFARTRMIVCTIVLLGDTVRVLTLLPFVQGVSIWFN